MTTIRSVSTTALVTVTMAHCQVLDEVQGNLDGLSRSCSQISTTLSSTKSSTSLLLGEMERLQTEYEAADRKAQLVVNFLDQYQLSAEEVRMQMLNIKHICV